METDLCLDLCSDFLDNFLDSSTRDNVKISATGASNAIRSAVTFGAVARVTSVTWTIARGEKRNVRQRNAEPRLRARRKSKAKVTRQTAGYSYAYSTPL